MIFPGYKTWVISKLCETLIMFSLYLTKTTHISVPAIWELKSHAKSIVGLFLIDDLTL